MTTGATVHSTFELLDATARDPKSLGHFAVAHRLPHLTDSLSCDSRVLRREGLSLAHGLSCSARPARRVSHCSEGLGTSHGGIVPSAPFPVGAL